MVDCSTIGEYQLHGLLRHGCIDTQNDGALEVVLLEITLRKNVLRPRHAFPSQIFRYRPGTTTLKYNDQVNYRTTYGEIIIWLCMNICHKGFLFLQRYS
jgi:hypothetical protein